MNDLELYKHIYHDCEMSIFSLETLLNDLKDKDNKIKDVVEDIKIGYKRYFQEVENLLKASNSIPKNAGIMAKMGASFGIDKEVKADNSDSNMADMLIKGISMGILDIEKKINDYKQKAGKEEIKYANKFLEFQKEIVEELKKFL